MSVTRILIHPTPPRERTGTSQRVHAPRRGERRGESLGHHPLRPRSTAKHVRTRPPPPRIRHCRGGLPAHTPCTAQREGCLYFQPYWLRGRFIRQGFHTPARPFLHAPTHTLALPTRTEEEVHTRSHSETPSRSSHEHQRKCHLGNQLQRAVAQDLTSADWPLCPLPSAGAKSRGTGGVERGARCRLGRFASASFFHGNSPPAPCGPVEWQSRMRP